MRAEDVREPDQQEGMARPDGDGESCADEGESDPVLEEAIDIYLAAQDAGQQLSGDELCKRYPTVQGPLREFLRRDQAIRAEARTGILRRRSGRFGGYEILEFLGRGGNGVVYRARQRFPDRVVALKILECQHLDASEARDLLEATCMARLDHPGIVPVYEAGAIDEIPYFSMKLVCGGTLEAHRERLGRDPAAVARILEKVARAVDHAHERGVLHRDLKPANILLGEDDEPHVADFGLARLLCSDTVATITRGVGTPSYMAPEQMSGGAGVLAASADVYSLGAILYELLAGKTPFGAPSPAEVMYRVLNEDLQPPRSVRAGLPRDLDTIAMKCLSRQPAARYPTARALADELKRFLDGKPIQARPLAPMERSVRWVRRHRTLASLGVVLALAGAALGVLQWRHGLERANVEQEQAQRDRDAKLQQVVTRRFHLAHQLSKADQAVAEGRLGEARKLLHRARALEKSEVAASFVARYLAEQCAAFREEVPFLPADVTALGWFPTIDALVLGLNGGDTLVRPMNNLNAGSTAHSARGAFEVSPDGTRLVTSTAPQTVSVFDVQRAEDAPPFDFWRPRGRQVQVGEDIAAIAFDPQDNTAVFVAGKKSAGVYILGILGASPQGFRGKLECGPSPLRAMVVAPLPRRLVTAHEDGKIRIWALKDAAAARPPGVLVGDLEGELVGHSGAIEALSHSPAGARLASVSADGTVRLWDLARRVEVGCIKLPDTRLRAVAIAPDARLVAAAGDARQVHVMRLRSGVARLANEAAGTAARDHGELEPLYSFSGHAGAIHALLFHPSRPVLISGGERQEALLWDLNRLENPQLLRNPFPLGGFRGAIRQVSWQRGTQRFVTLDETAQVRVHEVEGQDPPLVRSGPSYQDWSRAGSGSPALALDGLRLAVPHVDGSVEVWRLPVPMSDRPGPPGFGVDPDLARPRLEEIVHRHERRLCGVGFAADSRWLATADEGEVIRVWACTETAGVAHWQETACLNVSLEPHSSGVQRFADPDLLVFSSDRRLLAVAGRGSTHVALWRLDPGGRAESALPATHEMAEHSRLRTLAFTADGRHLVAGTEDHRIRFREVALILAGRVLPVGTAEYWELDDHEAAVSALATTPDGKYLVSGTDDGEVRFWDVIPGPDGISGPRHAAWRKTPRRVTGIVFSPDQRLLVTVGGAPGQPGEVWLWRGKGK